jgi:hypothetical protein
VPEFITLSCPSCGNKLQITSDIDRFACSACGNEHVVNRSGGIVTLKPVIDSIKRVEVGVDKTASELAIVRLKEEICKLEGYISYFNGSREEGRDLSCIGWVLMGIGSGLLILTILGVGVFLFLPIRSEILSTNIGSVICFGLPSVISFIGAYMILRWVSNKKIEQNKKIDEKVQPLMEKLKALKRELAKHQETVSKLK